MTQEETPQNKRKGMRSISLSIPDRTYMELLIKIRHENLNWKRFFNFLIQGFIEDDPSIMEYLDMQMVDLRAKARSKIIKKERKMVQDTIEVFGLDKNEIDDMYDILEEEFEP